MENFMLSVGYIGCDIFDVILYIARTLTKLNYKVLIVDFSETGSLMRTIKHGMELDSQKEIINYRDINYTRKMPSAEELKVYETGVVFIVYGFKEISYRLEFTRINIAVNTFPSVIDNINRLAQSNWIAESHHLLIRDLMSLGDVDWVCRDINYPFNNSDVRYLYFEECDYMNAVNCQATQVVRFTKISTQMKRYMIEQIHNLLPYLSQKSIKKAIEAARKGG